MSEIRFCHSYKAILNLRFVGFLLLFLFIAPKLCAAEDRLIFAFTFDPPSIQRPGEQAQVTIAGLPSIGNPGEPILPVRTARILLPPGQSIAEIQVLASQRQILPGSFRVCPGQMQIPLGGAENWQPTPPNEDIYTSPTPFPPQTHHLVGVWSLCGYQIAIINLHPVEYIPSTGTISYFPEMELCLRTVDSPDVFAQTQRMLRSPGLMAHRLAGMVDNPRQIEQYSNLAETPRRSKGSLVNPQETYRYVVITSQDLKPTFQTLAEFKTQRGQRATVVTVQEIGDTYSGQDLPEQIRNFILDAYTGWQTDFVLLGGDDEIIPHRGLYAQAFGYTETDIPADLYFGALDGDWNADGDQLWGEPGEEDLFAEVSVGRAPVDDQDEALHFVTKTIQYQQAPVPEQTTAALMAGEELWDNPLTYGGDYKDEIRFGATTNSCTTSGFPANFTVNTLYDKDLGSPWWGGMLLDLMNNGLHLINHLGHSSVEYALRLTADQVLNDLTNDGIDNSFMIIFSQGCYAASFDNRNPGGLYVDDCVAEAFLTGPHGAAAFVGNTRYGWASPGMTDGASQYFDRQFFDALFGENIYRLGAINDDSKIDNIWALDYQGIRWCFYEQTLLGDPDLDIWTELPGTLSVSHPTVLTIMEENSVVVQVESDCGPVTDALVCIRQGDQLYATDLTNHLGETSFALLPTTAETLDISVIAHNNLPYAGTILARTDGPWLCYSHHSVDDDQNGNSSGNGDGVINQGETVELTLWLNNFGAQVAERITTTLRSSDAHVEIIDSVQTFPPIPPEQEETSQERYLFAVDGGCPDGHDIEFTVEVRDEADGVWISTFSINVSAPKLIFETLVLDDDPPAGNGNGLLEAGESARMMITVRNIGSAEATSVSSQLSVEGDPHVEIERGTAYFHTIESGSAVSSRWPFYKITASEECPPFYFFDYTLNLSAAGDYAVQDTIPHAVGFTGLKDDMEDETTTWTHGGTGDLWHLSQGRARTPFHSWYGGSATHREYQNGMDAFLKSPMMLLISGSQLSFWHWYDLEEDRDFGYLEIYADSGWTQPGEPFTGNSQGWVRQTYDLSAYPNGKTLYIRFRMTSDEQNCGEGWYIDDVYVGLPFRFTLDQAKVSPERGEESTDFTFSTIYTSDWNYPPTSTIAYIDGTPYNMASADTDYTQGATFTCQTALDLGEHEYHFDFSSGLESTRWPRFGECTGPLVAEVIYQEDFEDWNGNFVHTGSDWEWGPPTSGPGQAHSGEKVWASVLAGAYSDNSDSRLETPPIDLTGITNPQLSFWHWYSFEYRQAHYDGGNVKISADGEQFQVFTPDNGYEGTISTLNAGIPGEPGFCLYNDGQFWHQETFDLSPYSGQQIVIRFHFGSNSRHTYPGWYIDDVVISGLQPNTLPAVSDLNLTLAGENILLSWSWPYKEIPAAYAIYRGILSNGPFAQPESIATVTATTYIDPSVAGNQPINYYYLVRALSFDGLESEPSERVGEFNTTTFH